MKHIGQGMGNGHRASMLSSGVPLSSNLHIDIDKGFLDSNQKALNIKNFLN